MMWRTLIGIFLSLALEGQTLRIATPAPLSSPLLSWIKEVHPQDEVIPLANRTIFTPEATLAALKMGWIEWAFVPEAYLRPLMNPSDTNLSLQTLTTRLQNYGFSLYGPMENRTYLLIPKKRFAAISQDQIKKLEQFKIEAPFTGGNLPAQQDRNITYKPTLLEE